MSTLSPFSARHEYTLEWDVIRTGELPTQKGLSRGSEKEDFILRSLANIGVIGSKQLKSIFLNNDKNRLKRMLYSKKILKHKIMRGEIEIPIFTLGVTGIVALGLDRSHINVWKTYSTKDVLQRLVAVQFYTRLLEIDPYAELMESTADPYVASFLFRGKPYHLIIMRDNENLIEYAFKESAFLNRTFIVAEGIEYVQNIENIWRPYVEGTRVTTDEDILTSPIEHLFYKYKDQMWVKENILEKMDS